VICKFIRIRGRSLEPLLMDGDIVLAVGLRLSFKPLAPGDLVIFRHEVYGQLVKQVEHLSPDGSQVFVRGTRPGSVDSLEFGPLARPAIAGKVVWRFKRG
jgi:signal peptidase I